MSLPSETNLGFRLIENPDRETVIALASAYYREDDNSYGLPRIVTAIDAVLAGDPLVRLWIIERNQTTIGYLCVCLGFALEAGGREFCIDEIYLLPEHRSRGIGRKAIAFAEQESRKLGATRVFLEVETGNQRAHALYQKLGFEAHPRVLMSKFLSQDT
ncbi:GNAT family N-acetyltransferase [Kiloniella laminariae]|uniref:GNAT family N-acetyltransferase n=1 Tax=Kiloniella laminariae TaxID=454162 RepID=UPI0003685684|nr:GNAT family N-acetyltransferase [Kiloniella laminariae]